MEDVTNTPKSTNDLLEQKIASLSGLHPVKGGLLKLPFVNVPALGIGTLFGTFVIGLIIASVVMLVLMQIMGLSEKSISIATVIQDIMAFIVPALVAAIVATRLPASLLAINVKPRLDLTLFAMAIVIIFMPAMNYIVALNQNLPLPAELEEILRGMENEAASMVSKLAAGSSILSMIISILIVGVLAGFSEELFFRGAMQNLFCTTRMNPHVAIWITAIIFSAIHFQFYGFVPRMLLGAFFGYLLWWTGSIWIPMICHTLNNTIAVVAQYTGFDSLDPQTADYSLSQFDAGDYVMIGFSVIFTVVAIVLMHKRALSLAESTQR